MSLAYGVTSMIALALLGVCVIIDRKKDIWLLLLFVSVFVCDFGYFLLSVSKTLNLALLSNRIAYFGNVFLPFFIFMMILKLCRIRFAKWLPCLLAAVSVLIFAVAASPGYLTVYYKTVSIEITEGVTRLVREYGPLHVLYYIYLFLYFGGMLVVVGDSIVKKRITSYITGACLLAAVLVNIVVWLIEQFLPRNFEFLSISYMLSEALILLLYGAFQKYSIERRIICVWTAASACVGIALLCKAVPPENPLYVPCNMIRSFLYMGMYYTWWRIACRGIIQKTQRRCLNGICILLIFWIAVSTCKHFVFEDNITVVRYLWYAYYIPQILIVVLSLVTVLMVGKGEDARPGKWGPVLFGSAAGLLLLVLTNDLHQLVFSFPEGEAWRNEVCTHEAGYYLIMALIALCSVGILAAFAFKCRVPGRKKLAGIPFLCLTFLIAYGILYFVEGSIVDTYLNDMTATGCLMIAALVECVIESGLLRMNIGYDELLWNSGLAVQIADGAHQVRYAGRSATSVPAPTLAAADAAPVMLDRSTRLFGAAICGGHIYWQEDVGRLLRICEKLEITQEELRDTGDVLKAESGQKAYRLHLEEENRLYDLVETQTARQVGMLRELTAQLGRTQNLNEAKRLLGKIVMIGTYIKRRSNLIFVAGQEQNIPAAELALSIKESAENLKLYGVDCSVRILDCEKFLPETANMIYDIFEAVIEKSMDTVSTLLLRVESENGGLLLTICSDGKDDLTSLCRIFPCVSVRRDEDDLWYLNMALEMGGTGR
ncbi:MAG: histidine kinase N-terminal 7TM domain-containing protein [Eubacteriales bacterium]|nr:histidine kinase N-terminal 7TM domain-containing protein [Eubacteriales bacterium]